MQRRFVGRVAHPPSSSVNTQATVEGRREGKQGSAGSDWAGGCKYIRRVMEASGDIGQHKQVPTRRRVHAGSPSEAVAVPGRGMQRALGVLLQL
ncbi:hypothetical protein E2C01_031060 [Portunus trituberculatus]|uniref:Uncharacterized protein n=1 Tax=Portunus trituberculatus TaxID=210409 RepID=A0A5B7EZ26_PORTR|nr:hypothetical protein [Portunus trituberculatus]